MECLKKLDESSILVDGKYQDPNKMRIVFDASGEYDGISLNKALLTGLDLLNNLVGVLLRFRNHKIAIAADIEAMYHQVRVSKSDANGYSVQLVPSLIL